MIKGRDFIITGLQPWDTTIGSNAKDIAIEISKHNRVLYVDTPLDMLTYFKGEDSADFYHRAAAYKEEQPMVRQINENLWVADLPVLMYPANRAPFTALFRLLNYWNNKRICANLKPIIDLLSFKDFILFVDNDIYRSFYAGEMLGASCSIYYRRDYLLGVDYWQRYGTLLEPELARRSDLVLTNSRYLADGMKCFNQHSYDIGQGVDLSAFDPSITYSRPNNMEGLASPIIGYVGVLTSLRLDIRLLIEVAQKLPEYSFVFVGPEDDVFRNSELHSLANVYFLGQQPQETIANYIATFDVCVNPQLVNDLTVGNYPRKVDEYLALGKPVIAVNTPMMELFERYVWLVDNADGFASAVREIIDNKEQEEACTKFRCEFAQSHTWTNSVAKMYNYIETVLDK